MNHYWFSLLNMEFEDYLQRLAHKEGLRQVDIVRATGAKKSAVNHWWKGVSRPIGGNALALARVLRVEPSDLIEATEGNVHKLDKYLDHYNTGSAVSEVESKVYKKIHLIDQKADIPILNSTQAADPAKSVAGGDVEDFLWVVPGMEYLRGKSFYFKVEDDSMVAQKGGKSYHPGVLALIEIGASPKPGEIVVANIAGESTAVLRRYKDRGRGGFELEPLNDNYTSVTISNDSEGVVLGVMRKFIADP